MKSLVLFFAILCGLFIPELSVLSGGIRFIVMFLLFQGFLVIEFDRSLLSREIFIILLLNLLLPFPAYLFFSGFAEEVSQSAFLVAATPTAIASPIVIGFIKKRTDFAAMAVLLSNIVIAFTMPLCIPYISSGGEGAHLDGFWSVTSSILFTIVGPFILAFLLRHFGGRLYRIFLYTKKFGLYIWACAIVIACAKARFFVIDNDISSDILVTICLSTFILCAANFIIGYFAGGKLFARECSQALGQKNTIFSVWVGLTFLNPLSAIGPVAYIIFQNIYNVIQMFIFEIAEKKQALNKRTDK